MGALQVARAAFAEAKAELARAEGLFDGAFTEAKRSLLIARLADAQGKITQAHRQVHLAPVEAAFTHLPTPPKPTARIFDLPHRARLSHRADLTRRSSPRSAGG